MYSEHFFSNFYAEIKLRLISDTFLMFIDKNG